MADLAAPAPMEARLVDVLPEEGAWRFEPKWDGFRAIAVAAGNQVDIRSKSGKSLARFFPEVATLLRNLSVKDFIVDGELVLPIAGKLSFDALQQRLHPAASRIERLARETPAKLILFDCLRLDGEELTGQPLRIRRAALERFHVAAGGPSLLLSPQTDTRSDALAWLERSGGALDGIVAKPLDQPYRPGERAMLKVKTLRTADCVVGGYRMTKDGKGVASLLLGLHSTEGRLDHVGFVSGFPKEERAALLALMQPLAGGAGFSGDAPGGPSRWRKAGEAEWIPVAPERVVEVTYDQVTGQRLRHGARFVRWRPDKDPRACTFEQLAPPLEPAEIDQLLARL